MRKLTILSPLGQVGPFDSIGNVSCQIRKKPEEGSNQMKYLTLTLACVALGMGTNTSSAEENPQRVERRADGPRAGGPQGRDPAAMVSKMLSEFDRNGDKMLNVQELTAMFTEMKERSMQGRSDSGKGRPGARNGPSGQGRTAARPGSGRPDKPRGPNAESGKQDRPDADRRRRPKGQRGGSDEEQGQKPGGDRPNRVDAK